MYHIVSNYNLSPSSKIPEVVEWFCIRFFYKCFFFNTEYRFKGCFFCIHIIKPLVCLCVCLMLRPVHIFGPISNLLISTDSPWYREGLKIISRVIGAGTKKNFNVHWFFQVGQKCPSDRCPSNRCLSNRCPSDRCLSDKCQSLI